MTDLAPYVEGMARRYIRAYARWLVNGYAGRGKLDSVYMGVTERRDGPGPKQWAHYSSCGDLSQEIVYHMGVRQPFVNRSAYLGWRSGTMLSDFYTSTKSTTPAEEPALGFIPGAGDIGFIWSDSGKDAHTLTFGDSTGYTSGGVALKIETFNYGAGGMSPTEFPGAKQVDAGMNERHSEPIRDHPGRYQRTLRPIGTSPIEGAHVEPGLWLGQRKLRYVLTVPRLLSLVDFDAMPAMTEEIVIGLEARVP